MLIKKLDRKELKDAPDLVTSYNMSPIFYSRRNKQATKLLKAYEEELVRKPCRGPLALWKAMWKTSINIYTMPLEWCVCRGGCLSRCGRNFYDSTFIPLIILHAGHKEVLDWYKNDSFFKKIRVL